MPRSAHAMSMLTLQPGLVTDDAAATSLAIHWAHRFAVQIEQTLETLHARHDSYVPEGADRDAIMTLLAMDRLPTEPTWIWLRRYQAGDCALPHRLRAELGTAAAAVRWALICPLTDSTVDGITLWAGERFVRIMDQAGRAVIADPDTWCWTSPVRGPTRYTMTLGGPDA